MRSSSRGVLATSAKETGMERWYHIVTHLSSIPRDFLLNNELAVSGEQSCLGCPE